MSNPRSASDLLSRLALALGVLALIPSALLCYDLDVNVLAAMSGAGAIVLLLFLDRVLDRWLDRLQGAGGSR